MGIPATESGEFYLTTLATNVNTVTDKSERGGIKDGFKSDCHSRVDTSTAKLCKEISVKFVNNPSED